MDYLWRSQYPHLVQTVTITSYTTFWSSLHQSLWPWAVRCFLPGHLPHSWSCHMTSLGMIWWSFSFLTKVWSCILKYNYDLTFALANFSWILNLSAWFSASCLFSRNSLSAIILASLAFSSRALSLEDLLLLDLVLLELPELADFDPIFEDLFDECLCSPYSCMCTLGLLLHLPVSAALNSSSSSYYEELISSSRVPSLSTSYFSSLLNHLVSLHHLDSAHHHPHWLDLYYLLVQKLKLQSMWSLSYANSPDLHAVIFF